MIKAIIYNKDTAPDYMYPTGAVVTPDIFIREYPGAAHFPMLVTISGNTIQAVQDFYTMRDYYSIDPALSQEAALAAIEHLINNPPPMPEPEPSAEERIAAAMEFQALNSLPTA